MKNIFWVVYDKKGQAVSLSVNKITAQQVALKLSSRRWTYDTFERDWGYLEKDGYKVLKSVVKPIK